MKFCVVVMDCEILCDRGLPNDAPTASYIVRLSSASSDEIGSNSRFDVIGLLTPLGLPCMAVSLWLTSFVRS